MVTESDLKRNCTKEGNCEFIFSGPGVERISEEVKRKFPGKKIQIFSSDTMNKKDSKEKIDKITNNEIAHFSWNPVNFKRFSFSKLKLHCSC